MTQLNKGRLPYSLGVALIGMTALLIVWTSIVRDDGHAAGSFMVILASGVSGYAARFRPEGWSRGLIGVAAMQIALGLLTATAPITAQVPDGPLRAWIFNGVFAVLWLAAALLFHRANRKGRG